MKPQTLFAPALFAAVSLSAADAPPVAAVALSGGQVKFAAATTLSAISVHGQSNEVAGRATLRRDEGKLWLENLEARVDPKSLNTGMAIRDQHMRAKIFTAGEALPELRFVSGRSDCLGGGREATCRLSGDLTLRGVTKPWSISVKVRPDGNGYRAAGAAVVKLSAFSVEAPCQLGVCMTDDVKVELDLKIREVQEASSLRSAR